MEESLWLKVRWASMKVEWRKSSPILHLLGELRWSVSSSLKSPQIIESLQDFVLVTRSFIMDKDAWKVGEVDG